MKSQFWIWLPIGSLSLLLILSVIILAAHRQISHRLSHYLFSSEDKSAISSFPVAMKDIDKNLLVATPSPRQIEQISASTFKKFYRGNPARKEIALTFDDGPHPESTPKLLAVLKKYHVKATFFVVGTCAAAHPALVKAEADAGHCIANHTFHHDRLTKVPNAAVPSEITTCTDIIQQITGKRTRLFRPPGGTFDLKVINIAESLGYLTILWSINTGDVKFTDPKIVENSVLSQAENGSIVLFHDRNSSTLGALPSIITKLKARGYKFVTIDDMLANK